MAFQPQNAEAWRKAVRRALLVGPPNSGKTTSFRTFPGPGALLSFPGEMGTTSIPVETGDKQPITSRVWDGAAAKTGSDAAAAIKSLKEATKELISAQPRSFMGDGLHKLFPVFMDAETFGAYSRGDEFDAKLWAKATGQFMDYLHGIMASSVENVAFTIWQAPEADSNTGAVNAGKKDRHIYPDLPGRASSKIVGEFALSLYAFREGTAFKWLTQPEGDIGGVGAKLPLDVLQRLPKRVDADWSKLMKTVLGEGA